MGSRYHTKKRFEPKAIALRALNGTDEESYNTLPKYCTDLLRNNSGSKIVLESTLDENTMEEHFQRLGMFVCYKASAIGFSFCRPVLNLDGTYLNAKYQVCFWQLPVSMQMALYFL